VLTVLRCVLTVLRCVLTVLRCVLTVLRRVLTVLRRVLTPLRLSPAHVLRAVLAVDEHAVLAAAQRVERAGR
jgi:hypothetical protein